MTGHQTKIKHKKVVYWTSASHATNNRESLLLIHGFGGTYSGLEDLAALLSEQYNLLGLDLPGYGLSEPLQERHTLRNYAKFLNTFCGATEFHKVNVVGHSFGADIAIVFAALFPNRVDKLVLISPVVFSKKGIARLGKAYYNVVSRLPKGLRHTLLHSHALTRLSDRFMFKQASEQQRSKILRDDYISDHLMTDTPTIESYLSLLATPFFKLAGRIQSKTLVISGSDDALSPADVMQKLQEQIPSSSLSIVQGAGHFLPLETPRPVAEQIIGFLDSKV